METLGSERMSRLGTGRISVECGQKDRQRGTDRQRGGTRVSRMICKEHETTSNRVENPVNLRIMIAGS